MVIGRALLLERRLRGGQRFVGRGERAQHGHAASVLDHLVSHGLLRGGHLARHAGGAAAQHVQHAQARGDARERDGRDGPGHGEEEQAHDHRHGHAARQTRQADGHELLQLVHRRGQRRGDGRQALLGEVAHGRGLQPVAHAQAQVAEDVEALRVHRDVHEVLEHVLPDHADSQDAQALQRHDGVEVVAVLERPEHRAQHTGHEERFQDVAHHAPRQAAPRRRREAASQVEHAFDEREHATSPP